MYFLINIKDTAKEYEKMQNTEVTETVASTYYNEVSTNETLNELRENVQKYLIAKLENNEC